MPRKPKLFIGSAKESANYARALEGELVEDAITEVWDTAFKAGQYTLEVLTRKASEADFAVFVLGQDDLTDSRGEIVPSPRDNVIYEAGLFTGRLGVARVWLLVDTRGCKIPTDYAGVGFLRYDPGSGSAKDAVHQAAVQIRKLITDCSETDASSIEQQMLGHWWQFVVNRDDRAVVSLLSISPSAGSSRWKLSGQAWTSEGTRLADFKSRAAALDVKDGEGKLFYYWEGDQPCDEGISSFVGVGEIEFPDPKSGPIAKAKGWYSDSPLAELNKTVQRRTRYRRAEVQDVEKYEGDDEVELEKARIDEWKSIRRAWSGGHPS